MFGSKHVLMGNQTSRRDDIIQIVYNMIYLLNPPNSWMYRFDQDDSSPQSEIRKFKQRASPEEICEGERCHVLIELCKEAYSYDYEDEPRYGLLRFILKKELLKLNVLPDKFYSFLQSNKFIGIICPPEEEEKNVSDGPNMDGISENGDSD